MGVTEVDESATTPLPSGSSTAPATFFALRSVTVPVATSTRRSSNPCRCWTPSSAVPPSADQSSSDILVEPVTRLE